TGLHRRTELVPGMSTPEEGPDGPRRKPMPIPHGPKPKPAQVPEEYKQMYEEQTGYANYYFNEQAVDRLLKTIQQFGDYSSVASGWSITASRDGTIPVNIRFLPDAIASKIGAEFVVLKLNEDP